MLRASLAAVAVLIALGGLIGVVATPAEAADSPAAQQAERMGVVVVFTGHIDCGEGAQIYGCYQGGFKVFVVDYLTDEMTEWVLWHELGHVLSLREDLDWSEADCNAYADRMTD